MRVLHVAPSIARSYGGPTKSLHGYVSASRMAGADVTVAAPSASQSEIEDIESAAGPGRLHTFAAAGRGAFVVSPAMVRWVANEARTMDVVHVHGLFNPVSSLSCRASLKTKAAVVLRPFGTLSRYTFEHRRTRLKKSYFAAIERANVSAATALHFTTATELEEARWHKIDFGNRAHVVPPPWLAEPHPATHEHKGLRRQQIVFLGRVDPIKNIEALLDSWPLVLRAYPEARLVIAGSGDDRYIKSLVNRSAMLRVNDTVSFAGFLTGPAKADLLGRSSALALPSHHENFGMVVLEAIAAGIPVVISPHVQLRDFVQANGFGIVAETTSSAFSDAILSVLGSDTQRERIARKAPALIAATYGPANIGKQLESMYLDALANRANSR